MNENSIPKNPSISPFDKQQSMDVVDVHDLNVADSEAYLPQFYDVLPDKEIIAKKPSLTPSLLKKRGMKKTTLSLANEESPNKTTNVPEDVSTHLPEITSGPEYIYAVGLSHQRLQYDQRYH